VKMDAQKYATDDLQLYRKIRELRRMIVVEIIDEIKEGMDFMTINDGTPRAAGKGNVVECEDRGHRQALDQVGKILSEIKSKL